LTITVWAALGCALAAQGASPAAAPVPSLTLAQALQRARANSPEFQAAVVAEGAAKDDLTQARAGLLPSLNYNNTYIYTQASRYIANNGVHEYLSQGDVHEALGFAQTAAWAKAQAGLALARAQAEIAVRGLVTTVTTDFYNVLSTGHKLTTAQQALASAQQYLKVSQDRENGGEVAHADVIKAQLEVQQKQRDLAEAQLDADKTRLDLAVLLFPNFDTRYNLVDDLDQVPPLPPLPQIQRMAGKQNPQLAAAQAGLAQARQDVTLARANFLPNLSLDYFYGIDAGQFAVRNQLGQPNLGSSATATLNIPVFDWGANRAKLHTSELRQQQARVQLSFTQRQLAANLQEFFNEATAAREELATLASSRGLAAESLRLTALRYQDGEATILELVDAQNTLTQARNAYDDGEVRFRVALATLQTLTGTF